MSVRLSFFRKFLSPLIHVPALIWTDLENICPLLQSTRIFKKSKYKFESTSESVFLNSYGAVMQIP